MVMLAMEMRATNLYLKGMASDPDSANIMTVERYSQLMDITQQISMATCDSEFIRVCSLMVQSNTCNKSTHYGALQIFLMPCYRC